MARQAGLAESQAGRRFGGAIFDVDGVLVATPHERAWREALHALMADEWHDCAAATRYCPDRFTTAMYQQVLAGKPRLDGARAALTYFGVPDAERRAPEYAACKQARLAALLAAGAFSAFPDGLRFALALKGQGLRLAVASSSKNATALLRQIELAPYVRAAGLAGTWPALLDLFDTNLCGRDLPRGKPDPLIFLVAAHELELPPATCLVVEDAPAGVQAAKAGGMAALGVARRDDAALLTAAGADLVVTTLDDVALAYVAAGRLRHR
jgi:beta-phosphoglucomutase-like phosphatase (HAD superfamily)